MRALSLTQPWAWSIVHGPKRIENRGWPTRFRGDFFIHAARGMTRKQYDSAKSYCADRGVAMPQASELLRGGIIGIAKLTGLLLPVAEPSVPWHMPNQFGFVLEDVRPLPFKPCRGMLGFFEVSDD